MQLLETGARSLLGLCLTVQHLAAFQSYYDALVEWNRRFNLTAITDYQQVQIKHFLDSLTCLLALPPAPEDAWPEKPLPEMLPVSAAWHPLLCIDVGSGAGFPGIPLKIIRPELRLTLLEATQKKTAFLRHIVDLLELKDAEVVTARAEELGQDPHYRERYDVVLARAVAELPVLAEYCLPFARQGGRFVAQKGSDISAEVAQAQGAISLLGGTLKEIRRLALPDLSGERSLVIINKVRPTPSEYPRRTGIPSKRPLK